LWEGPAFSIFGFADVGTDSVSCFQPIQFLGLTASDPALRSFEIRMLDLMIIGSNDHSQL